MGSRQGLPHLTLAPQFTSTGRDLPSLLLTAGKEELAVKGSEVQGVCRVTSKCHWDPEAATQNTLAARRAKLAATASGQSGRWQTPQRCRGSRERGLKVFPWRPMIQKGAVPGIPEPPQATAASSAGTDAKLPGARHFAKGKPQSLRSR